MQITQLKLKNFRNYASLVLTPHPGVNLFFGRNGSGKTNLLEAVHYCALGRSHRTPLDREIVSRGAESGACGVTVSGKSGDCEIQVRITPAAVRKKQVWIDRKRAPRIADLMGRVRCVIFSPEDLMLVREGPALRRRYLDMMLSQLSTRYFLALQEYQKALDQRSALLRQAAMGGRPDGELLSAFERELARASAVILPMRREFAVRASQIAGEKYAGIAGAADETFVMAYQACLPEDEDPEEAVAARLKKDREEDIRRGTTHFGVHREDLRLTLNGREMKLFASQGQNRTAALSMKLAQLELFRSQSGETPILLLDDVMSELDMTRRKRLLQEIGGAQTFVTCTDESDLDGCADRRTYRVSLGEDRCAAVTETGAGEAAQAPEVAAEPDFS